MKIIVLKMRMVGKSYKLYDYSISHYFCVRDGLITEAKHRSDTMPAVYIAFILLMLGKRKKTDPRSWKS